MPTAKSSSVSDVAPAPGGLGALRPIPYMGVIFVVAEAMKLGFRNGDPDWCNLGQGQPEVGEMEGAPARISSVEFDPGDHAYGPIGGTDQLRTAIADHYNRLYRVGKKSQYTLDNVSVAAGGRLMLTRIFAALDAGNVGYAIPDYTAYEDLFDYHRHRIQPVAIHATEESGFALRTAQLDAAVAEHSLGALLISNPCNPTGWVLRDQELDDLVASARRRQCTLILDEFYSHFHYSPDGTAADGPVSAAAYVDDVNDDPVLLIDGLTKGYRYPGWRIGWTVGPASMIEVLGRAASAIDGGPSQPMQRCVLQVLDPQRADQETTALRNVFAAKRNLMLERLQRMGIRCPKGSEGTFYQWACLDKLPAPLNNADEFFRRALEHKVMTVPGRFFDVNPGKLREGPSPLESWMRFSFGPPIDNVRLGLDRLEKMISEV